ncbi:glycosyltransferase family 87 protein [Sphingomicrobium lutaoense]|uniref:DUF2029 domain-containing protein n=1 Tax=Sphingomicrobium lutaoense TaxID=515949 RepID=A0A839YZZ2_9SPHN|nr:glycosyltransferase family 87 protein [Sphingomicrobium lutaoense]MBB3764679.1 hypothetical protein [Sphingomicrobium lutaoense]
MTQRSDGLTLWARIALVPGLILVAVLVAIDWQRAADLASPMINGQAIWGRDFANVWSAGRILFEGNLPILYDIPAYQAWQAEHLAAEMDQHNYSYPPTSLLYVWLPALLPYTAALIFWLVASAAAFFLAARPWLREAGLSSWIALLLPTSALCLWAGHYGLFFGALWLIAWREVDRRPALSGVATGLMIIKPHLALLMPLLFALRRQWRAFGFAALTVGLLVGASILLFGIGPWQTYLSATSGVQLSLVDNVGTYFALMMPSMVTTAFAYGEGPELAWGLQIASGLIVLALLIVRPPRDAAALGLLAAIATFLILPYGFNYDMTVVGLAALLLAHRSAIERDWARLVIAALVVSLPPAMLFIGRIDIRPAPILLFLLFLAAWSRPELLTARRDAVRRYA